MAGEHSFLFTPNSVFRCGSERLGVRVYTPDRLPGRQTERERIRKIVHFQDDQLLP